MPELTVTWREGWLWLGGSLFLAALCTNLAWFFRQPRPGVIGEFITYLVAWRFSPWLLQLVRLLYYIGVPFAAFLWGRDAVIGRLLGLQPFALSISGGKEARADVAANWLDWAHDIGWAVALGIGAWGLLALGWWAYRRFLITAGITAGEGDMVAGANGSGWVLLREAAYHEAHWAFYRNTPSLAVGTYWGLWTGLLLVALEAMLNPAWRKDLADPQRAPARLLRGALAVVSGALFLLTQNLWLALTLHWGVSWGLTAFARALPLLSIHKPDQIPA